jgi:glycosyltransferase involved in cell wall biosynthesis
MCRALVACGHRPEVFVTSDHDETFTLDNTLVHRVSVDRWRSRMRVLQRIAATLPMGRWAANASGPILARALALGGAVRRREGEVAFDCIQSADYDAAGLFVPRNRRRVHVIRASSAADLWMQEKWRCRWELLGVRRGDRAYAPSCFVANHLRSTHGINVSVIRPPLFKETGPSTSPISGLPPRYLLHFGQIGLLKGADFLAESLPLVWQEDPTVRVVLAGRDANAGFERWHALWGGFAENVTYLGAISKPDVYQVLQRSVATALPSRADNLPCRPGRCYPRRVARPLHGIDWAGRVVADLGRHATGKSGG